jgi:hypothetical protein
LRIGILRLSAGNSEEPKKRIRLAGYLLCSELELAFIFRLSAPSPAGFRRVMAVSAIHCDHIIEDDHILRHFLPASRDTLVHAKARNPVMFFYALRAFAISGATDTVLTPLSRVSVASTASTPER